MKVLKKCLKTNHEVLDEALWNLDGQVPPFLLLGIFDNRLRTLMNELIKSRNEVVKHLKDCKQKLDTEEFAELVFDQEKQL